MNRLLYIKILFVFLYINVTAQNFKIEYQNQLDLNDKRIFTLDIKNDKAHFYANEKFKTIKSINENFYDFKNNKSYLVFPEQKIINITKDYLVERPYVKKWQITNHSKTILGYKCTEAIADIFDPVLGKNIKVKIWYRPKIKYKIGPNGLLNTPGLVLELETDYYKFTATKVITKPAISKINFPDFERVTYNKINEIIGFNI
nr:GLPGLI family protein [uncultured Flavobacterium sp.]